MIIECACGLEKTFRRTKNKKWNEIRYNIDFINKHNIPGSRECILRDIHIMINPSIKGKF